MKKYLKVMFGNKGANFVYKINEINVADNWNPQSFDPQKMGGFNFSTEDKILRWLVRGDTLYDILIPSDAQVIVRANQHPHGVFRSNKIILTNPRIMTDEMAMEFYLKSDLPEKSYYKSLAGCAIRGYRNTCLKIINDRINKQNIDLALEEINDFIKPSLNEKSQTPNQVFTEVMNILNDIKK